MGDRFYRRDTEANPESSYIFATHFNNFKHGGTVSSTPRYNKLQPETKNLVIVTRGNGKKSF